MNRITALAATAALTAGSLALATPAGAAPAQARTYKVTAKANIEIAVAREDTVKVRGKVSPKAAGEKVILQQRVGDKKKWRATGTAKVKKNGKYLLKDKPSTAGTREYRVVKPASHGIRKGVSKTMDLTVYRWEGLAFRPAVSENFSQTGVNVGAEFYGQSLATTTAGTASSLEYTLGRKCISLRSTYGLTDESPSGATGSVAVSGDGAVLASHPLAIGTIVADEVVDITGVFRLRIDATTSETPAGIVAVAAPEVLCTP